MLFQSVTARNLPLCRTVDVAVAGGTLAAVAAAVAAAAAGASVFLAAPRLYLGEDLASTLCLSREKISTDQPLTEACFGGAATTTPLRLKRTLEGALLKAKVDFVLGAMVPQLLTDRDGHPAGFVLADRNGRQAILARTVIDATAGATLCRHHGCPRREWTGGNVHATRTTIDATEPEGNFSCRVTPLELSLPSTSLPALARVEQTARDLTWRRGQVRGAETIRFLPPDPVLTEADDITRDEAFRPRGTRFLRVLGPQAAPAGTIEDSAAWERTGTLTGDAAAKEAAQRGTPVGVELRGEREFNGEVAENGDLHEALSGLRPSDAARAFVPAAALHLPVLGEVEVLVVGAGTAGAAAATGAARRGAKVLVIEYQSEPGGIGTVGLIGTAYHGRREGFAAEVPFPDRHFTLEDKMEWLRRAILDAGGEIWTGVLAFGALCQGNSVVGAAVASPWGIGVVRARVVVDATGNGDVATAAGAAFQYGEGGRDIALQGTGIALSPLGTRCSNSDFLLVDDSDPVDTTRAVVGARQALAPEAGFDTTTMLQTRERRRIVCDHTLTYLDQILGRTYPDSVVLSRSDYDSHGYPSDPYFAFLPHTEETRRQNHPAPGGSPFTPYRSLLPMGLEGILVLGLAIGMERDASALIRMQLDLLNQGYAGGVAAAVAVAEDITPRGINIKFLQHHLVETGCLPPEVLAQKDSFPLPREEVIKAVQTLTDTRSGYTERALALAVTFTHQATSRPLLRATYTSATGEGSRICACLLGCWGEETGAKELAAALDEAVWDEKIYQGGMAEFAHLPTPVDALILALGRGGSIHALPALLRKLETLDATLTLSHHRSLALALEALGSKEATEALARLLNRPGMGGHAMRTFEAVGDAPREGRRREGSLREITLARALLACGDFRGIGRAVLTAYAQDLRGLFAQHAGLVLKRYSAPADI